MLRHFHDRSILSYSQYCEIRSGPEERLARLCLGSLAGQADIIEGMAVQIVQAMALLRPDLPTIERFRYVHQALR